MLDGDKGKETYDRCTMKLAEALNSGKPSELHKLLAAYNREASHAASGQPDIFSGGVPTREELMNLTKEQFKNGTTKGQQALVDAGIADWDDSKCTNIWIV